MYSRAHLLIAREQEKFLADQPWGIEAWPMYDDSMFEWMAKIKGLQDSPWEGGIFKVYIRFDEHFNVRPPQLSFQTIPFHPNVEVSSGRPCIDFLDDYTFWQEDFSLTMILLSLQVMLSNPVLKNAVNPEAAQMFRSSPESYHQMALECVAASQRVEAGGSPLPNDPDPGKVRFDNIQTQGPRTAQTRGMSKMSKLSFDDYHKTWCGIGTSKTKADAVNPLLDSLRDNPKLQEIHLGLPRGEVEDQMRKQMEDHSLLMYGRFKTKPTPETVKQAKLAQLKKMQKIYLPPRQSPQPPTNQDIVLEPSLAAGLPATGGNKEDWEKEVDDLVKWTDNLDSNAIDAT